MDKKKGSIIIFAALGAILIGFSSMYISSYGYDEKIISNFFVEKEILLYNIIPIFLIILILTNITKSISIGFLITSIVINVGAYINYIKIIYREEPLLARDISLFREALTMSKKYDLNFSSINAKILFASLLISIILFYILTRFSYTYKFRTIQVGVFLIMLIFMSRVYLFDYDIYHKLGAKAKVNIWLEIDSYKSKGFVYPFIYSINSSKPYKYKNYDKLRAMKEYEKYQEENIEDFQKLNIICVMCESFKDFYKYRGPKMEFTRDPYEKFHQIQNESIYGNLLVNSFGGGTFITESNFLSGYKHNPPFNRKTQSYVRYLKGQGYTCHGFHPNVGTFYNRNRAYKNLGFDKFFEYENTFKAINENLLMDREFYDFIYKDFEEHKKNSPYFCMAVTYQNHGPYINEHLLVDQPYIKWQEGYDRKWFNYFNNYLCGIESASSEIGKFTQRLEEDTKPTIFIMFGDHSPSMGDNKILFDMFEIESSQDTSKGLENTYQTPYIIWANSAAKAIFDKDFKGKGKDLEPAFLMSQIFTYLGIKASPYNQVIQDLTKDVTVLKENWFCINGNYYSEPNKAREKIENFNNIEYYVSHIFDKEK